MDARRPTTLFSDQKEELPPYDLTLPCSRMEVRRLSPSSNLARIVTGARRRPRGAEERTYYPLISIALAAFVSISFRLVSCGRKPETANPPSVPAGKVDSVGNTDASEHGKTMARLLEDYGQQRGKERIAVADGIFERLFCEEMTGSRLTTTDRTPSDSVDMLVWYWAGVGTHGQKPGTGPEDGRQKPHQQLAQHAGRHLSDGKATERRREIYPQSHPIQHGGARHDVPYLDTDKERSSKF